MKKAAPIGEPLKELTAPQVLCEEQMKVTASLNLFPGWRKVLHPSWLVTTTGQASPALSKLR